MDFRITCNLGLPLHVASFLKVGRGASPKIYTLHTPEENSQNYEYPIVIRVGV